MDDHIGGRLRTWRRRRGLTQRTLAELAGFTQGYVAQIESGRASLDKHSARVAFATALRISVRELTGQPEPSGPYRPVAAEAMSVLRSGLLALRCPGLVDPPDVTGPMPRSLGWETINRYYFQARYDLAIPAIGDALLSLAAGSHAVTDPERPRWAEEVVRVCSTAASACLQMGHTDLAVVAAETATRAARDLSDLSVRGVANYALACAVFAEPGAIRVAEDGIDLLSDAVGAGTAVAIACGMHHLIAAMKAARTGRAGLAKDHLGEAARIAAHTGERQDEWAMFGPTNVGIWRVGMLVALGEGPAATVAPPGFDPAKMLWIQRSATYYVDLARAHLQARGTERSAAAALYRADTIAPQHVCCSEEARTALRTLLSRPRLADEERLRGMAHRIGAAGQPHKWG